MAQQFRFVADPAAAGTRLDVWLTAQLATALPQAAEAPAASRAGVQRLIRTGMLQRNGSTEANPARKLRAGESYLITVPEPAESRLQPENIPLAILYEDADLIVLNKPAGLTVHPAPGNETGTLVQALLHHCGTSLSGLNGERRPGIVHRLDKDTSGVMVAAKHDAAHRGLARQFARHSIHRRYLALVRGVPLPAVGTIQGAIGRHPTQRLRRAVVGTNTSGNGKPATTRYQTLASYGRAAALVACTLETGRTHQIRVHMAHLGHPLLGDWLYGHQGGLPGWPAALPLAMPTRQMLHAAELGFNHPLSGKALAFSVPPPADMQAIQALLATACGQG